MVEETMTDKIIFLDIDGPMIPSTSYLFEKHVSFRQVLNKQCVGVLRKIIDASGAKIVFNTTHNRMLGNDLKWDTPGLRQRFYDAGFKEDIHEDDHTIYPDTDRLTAINEWLSRNKTDNMLWVALDDAPINHKRAVLVDFDAGLTLKEYNKCASLLMYKPFWVL